MAIVTVRKHRQSSPLIELDFGPHLDRLDVPATIQTVTGVKVEREVRDSTGATRWVDVTAEFDPLGENTDGRSVFVKPSQAQAGTDQIQGEHKVIANVTLTDGQIWSGWITMLVDATADESAA